MERARDTSRASRSNEPVHSCFSCKYRDLLSRKRWTCLPLNARLSFRILIFTKSCAICNLDKLYIYIYLYIIYIYIYIIESFVEIISNFVVLFFDKCRDGEFEILELNFEGTDRQQNLIYFQINFISTKF